MFKQCIRQGLKMLAFLCVTGQVAALSAVHAQASPAHGVKRAELGATAASDSEGRLWSVGKHVTADGVSALVLRHSENDGRTWSAPQTVVHDAVATRGEERPKIAFGPKDELYLVYTRPRGGGGNPHIGDIRFVRSTDKGKTFSDPIAVHANRDPIVHSFGSMIVDRLGNIFVAWVDSRDKEAAKSRQAPYTGNGVYYTVSTDGGKSFRGDHRIADHTCECCRLSMTLDALGRPVVMWRHIFAPNIRDHALAELRVNGKPGTIARASFDDWRVDACPHHGPSVAFAPDGTRHQAWFSGKDDEGGIFYASADRAGKLGAPHKLGTGQAKQPDVGVFKQNIAIVWKQFNGESTALMARVSADGGRTWSEKEIARTAEDSDRPQVLHTRSGLSAAWPTQKEGMRIIPLADAGKE